MHHKNIKLIVRKQLKNKFPNWSRLNRKRKKKLAKEICEAVINGYKFDHELDVPVEELIGIEEQMPTDNIMNLDEMTHFLDTFYQNRLFKFSSYKRSYSNIVEEELKFIHELLDNQIINLLLSYDGYSPCMREFYPCNFLRAELLKAIKYPEISYRKFCTEEYLGLDRKQNREFVGLPLNKKLMIDHTQLCQFRASITFSQLVNVLVYILHHFYKSGILDNCVLHGIDSTELANDNRVPLCSIDVNGQKIRIYNDIDCDCGKRRNKRDKSPYVVGYRMHTLTAINAQTGHSFPLVSLLAPANHHDSNFLKPLIKLAQAIGVDVKLITADKAYHDSDASIYEETGVRLITPPSSKVPIPENVDPETRAVTLDEICEIPMVLMGREDEGHEFKCGADPGACPRSTTCPQFRIVPFDSGYFQPIPHDIEQADRAIAIRKNSERPFNLLKNQTGLEDVRVRSQHALLARSTFSTIATLLLEMVGTRKKEKTDNQQMELFDIAA